MANTKKPTKPKTSTPGEKFTLNAAIDAIADLSRELDKTVAERESLRDQLALQNKRNDELYDQWQFVNARALNANEEYDKLVLRNTDLLRLYHGQAVLFETQTLEKLQLEDKLRHKTIDVERFKRMFLVMSVLALAVPLIQVFAR